MNDSVYVRILRQSHVVRFLTDQSSCAIPLAVMVCDTRQKLVETAVDLIWQSSYGAVSVDDICHAAGVNKGSFYHFFPSKAALAAAAMDDHFSTKRPALDAAFSPDAPPLERFANLAAMIIASQEEAFEKYGHVCGCPFAALGSEIAGLDETIRAKSDEIFAVYRRYCEDALRDAAAQNAIPDDADTAMLAEEISSYITGQMTMARIQNSLESLRRNLKEGIFRVIGAYDFPDGHQWQKEQAEKAG